MTDRAKATKQNSLHTSKMLADKGRVNYLNYIKYRELS